MSVKSKLILEVKAKTKNQYEYMRCIAENVVTLCYGPAGSGKTFLAAYMATRALMDKKIDKIIVTRPMVQCGKGLGFLKGSLDEKFLPYMAPLIGEFDKLLGVGIVKQLMHDQIIQTIPLELMRGQNFHNSFMILDEASNATFEQIKMFLTRIGDNSKCILTGDLKQTDLFNCDYHTITRKLEDVEGIGIAQLDYSDIVRSNIISRIVSKLDE